MRMAALTSNFKELSASIKFVLVFFNKGSLFRTMRGFESQSAQVSAHVACLMFDLFILCLVQEHWALLYFSIVTDSITLDKGVWVFLFVLHLFSQTYVKTWLIRRDTVIDVQTLFPKTETSCTCSFYTFFVHPYPHSRILLILSIDSVPVRATEVINVSLKDCSYFSISLNCDLRNALGAVPASVNCDCSCLWKQLGLRFQQLDLNHSNFSCTS